MAKTITRGYEDYEAHEFLQKRKFVTFETFEPFVFDQRASCGSVSTAGGFGRAFTHA